MKTLVSKIMRILVKLVVKLVNGNNFSISAATIGNSMFNHSTLLFMR